MTNLFVCVNTSIIMHYHWYSHNENDKSSFDMPFSTLSVLRFFWLIRHESPRYNHVFSEKAQHLWRWISLRMLTRGRLVPRQPWAIKRTTRTELRGENIHYGGYIHWNTGIKPTALRRCNIRNYGFIHGNAGIISTTLRINDKSIRLR